MMTIDKLCEILKAYYEGKKVEAYIPDGGYWYTANLDQWKLHEMLKQKLRIKPERRDFWVLVYRDDSKHVVSSKKEADEWVAESSYPPDVVHCREVLAE